MDGNNTFRVLQGNGNGCRDGGHFLLRCHKGMVSLEWKDVRISSFGTQALRGTVLIIFMVDFSAFCVLALFWGFGNH